MESIQFKNISYYNFACEYLTQSGSSIEFIINEDELSLQISNSIIARLLISFERNSYSILLFEKNNFDEWLFIAKSRTIIDHLILKLNRFLHPTYGAFPNNILTPTISFTEENLFGHPFPYFYWRSPEKNRKHILDTLEIWLNLDEFSPDLRVATSPKLGDLIQQYHFSLAAHNWDDAEDAINKIRQFKLTSFTNIIYLDIELLAQKQEFANIWENIEYKSFLKQELPRNITVAFLKAFHHQELRVNEINGRLKENIDLVGKYQTEYSTLLKFRPDIIDDICARVFIYLSVVNKTNETFEEVTSLPNLSENTKALITDILPLLEEKEDQSPISRFNILFQNNDFKNAYEVAKSIPDELIKIPFLMQSLARLKDSSLINEVLDQYYNLTDSKKKLLLEKNPLLPIFLEVINSIKVDIPENEVQNILDWFDLAIDDPENPILSTSLDHLEVEADKEFWNIQNLEKLREYLSVITFDKSIAPETDLRLLSTNHFERAMNLLISLFVKDDQFPQNLALYGDIYTNLYYYLLNISNANNTNGEIIIRLADDLISRNPLANSTISKELLNWIEPPRISVLSIWLDIVELGVYHGLPKEYLFETFQKWMNTIFDSPINFDRSLLFVLISFCNWFGEFAQSWKKHLESRLVETSEEATDPITLLPEGYRIIIYTLDDSSARRVQSILLSRNPNLDVHHSNEKSMTSQLREITINSDMQVLVTTCMKHSVFYGISDISKNIVYPQSRGSTSILRAIENNISNREK